MFGSMFKAVTNVLGGPAGQFLQFVPGFQALTPFIKMAAFLKEIQNVTGESDPLKAVTKFFTDGKYANDAEIIEKKINKRREEIIELVKFGQENNIPLSRTFEDMAALKKKEEASQLAANNRQR